MVLWGGRKEREGNWSICCVCRKLGVNKIGSSFVFPGWPLESLRREERLSSWDGFREKKKTVEVSFVREQLFRLAIQKKEEKSEGCFMFFGYRELKKGHKGCLFFCVFGREQREEKRKGSGWLERV